MKLASLHAHFSNIHYIEQCLSSLPIESMHFVDPGLLMKVQSDEHFSDIAARRKVKEQIEWIAETNVDAILITCTNYIALLDEVVLDLSVPIIKIDEPYFSFVCSIEQPQIILFTNPATVTATMQRLKEYAISHHKLIDVEAVVIDDSFHLLMQGKKYEYNEKVTNFIMLLMEDGEKNISVAQLSMVEAADRISENYNKMIMHPLKMLASTLTNTYHSEKM
ncbi:MULTISPECIES: hypothetical protein [Bacillus]|uniref:hypothetical protein n=1 Tax=Bacillus TaxID=1386 RepID=UPI0002F2887E|nr:MULTISPECIES: hypothetical protein [Bacillus]